MAIEQAENTSNAVKVYAVRHAPPQVKGICYGRTDVAVTLSPEEAAARLLPQLPVGLERIYTSPSQRAASVGARVAEALGLPLEVCPELLELDFGGWEGQRWNDIHCREPDALSSWAEDPLGRAPPGGETAAALATRVFCWVARNPLAESLAISHAGPIRALRAVEECRPSCLEEFLSGVHLDFTRDVPHLVVEPLLLPRVSSVRPRRFQQ